MRKTTSVIVGVTSLAAVAASWVAGLAPAKPASVSGAHIVAAGPPRATETTSSEASSGDPTSPAKSSSRASSGDRTAAPKPTHTAAPAPPTAPVSGTVVGGAADTPYGVVQVKVSYTGTKITNVHAVHLTDSSQTSVSISAQAAPILRQEALAAQSAQIDAVSGATYTSEGYMQSLQSAIDAAHLS